MKSRILKTIIFICLSYNSVCQIKVINNGNVGIGISFPNHSLHVYGFDQIFNYNSKELLFRANNANSYSTISSNLGTIEFWHPAWGWNTIKRGSCLAMSDIRVKTNITDIQGLLSTVKQLNPKKFKYVDSIIPDHKFHYGFIAQDVQKLIPELVDTNGQGFLMLNYEGLIPFLVGAVKEQSAIIDSLRGISTTTYSGRGSNPQITNDQLLQQIQDLKSQIDYIQNNCCQKQNSSDNVGSKTATNSIVSVITNNDFLLQNVPNPFDNTTTIKYKIPDTYSGKFFIKIYDLTGVEKLTYEINKQDQQIIISPSILLSGMYLYSLIANNEILATKQMIISK
jgi:hypothetical protein